jgi:hypothetical protein
VSGELVRPGNMRENGGKGGGCGGGGDCFKPVHKGEGWLVGWCHTAGEDREREGERGGSRSTGSGLRPVGASGVARPCHAADQIGEGEGG